MDAPVSNGIIAPGTAIKLEATVGSGGFFWGDRGGFPPPPDVWKELSELRALVHKQAKQLEDLEEQIVILRQRYHKNF